MKLYFVRHGQTDANISGFALHADDDAPLNQTGLSQAAAAARLLQGLEPQINMIASSPYLRTRQTAKTIAETYNIPFFLQNELREADFRGLQGKTIDEVYETLQKNINTTKIGGIDELDDSGESWSMIGDRMVELVNKLCKANFGVVVLVSHSLPIHIAVAKLASISAGDAADIHQDFSTGSVSKLTYEDGLWTIDFLNKTSD